MKIVILDDNGKQIAFHEFFPITMLNTSTEFATQKNDITKGAQFLIEIENKLKDWVGLEIRKSYMTVIDNSEVKKFKKKQPRG